MRSIHLRSLLLASSILTLASGAYAQEAAQVEEVVVTGTRLQTSGFQTPTPVTVLGAEAMNQRAPSTIADVVNELPAFRQSATNTQNQRGNGNGGQNRVDLRGLGTERTLVLLDGRRFVPTNLNGTIDVNLIPTPLVERVEVVTGGASAAYGSDAVSGVVNFIIKDRIQGVQGTVQYGASEHGDNLEKQVSLAGGFEFAAGRGRVVVGGDYSDNQGIGTLYTRDWGRKQPGLVSFGALAARGNLPAQGLLENVTYSTQADGGVINAGPLRGTAFGVGGAPFAFQYGTVYSNLMVGGKNGFDANPFGNWKIKAPAIRTNVLGRATFDINDDTSVFGEVSYGKQENNGLSSYHQAAALIVPISNPYIPASVRAQMVALNLPSITVGRYESQLGGYKILQEFESKRAVVGIKGKLPFEGWNWDAYFEHGKTEAFQSMSTNIFEGNYLASTYVVTNGAGQAVCGPTATNPNLTGAAASRIPQIQPGCVPFNIFGRESPSKEALEYIRFRSRNDTGYTQDVVAVNVTGSPFELWAGPVSLAGGLEHRNEEGFSRADPFGAMGVALSNNGTTYAGEVKVTEGYLETGIPLLKDSAWAQTLDFNAAVRRTNYSTSGSVTTWKAGFTYEPNDLLRFRVTRSRDIRAANISELFLTRNSGITASFLNPINNRTGSIFTISGGNPDLKPEVADSLTAGVVFQPTWDWAQGFRLSVDYYSVDIADVIASVAAADIARRCANGIQSYCDLITFDNSPSGIQEIRSTPANLNRLKTNGLDIEAAYRVPLDNWSVPGRLDVRSLTTWVDDLTTIDAVSDVDRAGSGALGGVPSITSSLNLTYALARFSNTLQFRYTSQIKGDATLVGSEEPGYNPALSNSINRNVFPSAVYVNWSAQYDLLNQEDGRTLQVFGLVNNLLDKDPAALAIVAFASGGNPYDVVGRTYKVGLRFKF